MPDIYAPVAGQEPLIGYRCWRVQRDQLCPPAHNVTEPWQPGINRAVCRHSYRCQKTSHRCSCGLYAIGDNSPYHHHRTHYFDLDTCLPRANPATHIIGAVLLFDTKYLFESSFARGHYAVITGLLCPPIATGFDEEVFYALCDRYAVPFANDRHELRQTATDHILTTSWQAIRQQRIQQAEQLKQQAALEQQQRLFGWGGHVAVRPRRFV